jgi:hypothetical protein
LQSIQAFQASKKLKGLREFSCVGFVEFSIDFEDDMVVGLLPLGRQAQLCRANNYRAMSSDYYMDNTLQKCRVPVFVMLPLDLIVFGECKQMKLRRYIKLALLFPLFVVNFFFFLLSSPTLSNWKLFVPLSRFKKQGFSTLHIFPSFEFTIFINVVFCSVVNECFLIPYFLTLHATTHGT